MARVSKRESDAPKIARLAVKVSPKASRNAVQGWMGDTLKIAVTAAPERGKANEAVIEVLADMLGVPRSAIRVSQGHVTPRKILDIDGLSVEELRRRLPAAPGGGG